MRIEEIGERRFTATKWKKTAKLLVPQCLKIIFLFFICDSIILIVCIVSQIIMIKTAKRAVGAACLSMIPPVFKVRVARRTTKVLVD